MTIMHSEAPSPLPAQEIKPLQKNTSATSSLRHSRLCGAALLAFIIPHSSFVIAAPPPELTVLRQQYDKAYAERVTAVFEANKAALDAKFTTALDNAITTAKASGDLPTVLAIQEDKKAIEAKQDLPADTDSIPATLKTLRSIYREQLAKLTEQRTANTTALLTPYAAKLQQLEATLTKNDRVEEAKEVMDYRISLKADAPAPQAVMTASTPATSETTAVSSTTPARTFPPANDRQVAEWVIALGCSFDLNYLVDGKNGRAEGHKPESWPLPSGEVQITRILLQFGQMPKKAYKNLEPLAGLQHITQLQLYNMPITDADTDVLASMPKLRELLIQENKSQLRGERMHLLKEGCPMLKNLFLDNCGITAKGALAISSLAQLEKLNLEGSELTDKDLPYFAAMVQLKELSIGMTKTSAEALAKLGSSIQPIVLSWSPTPRKTKAEFALLGAAFPNATFFRLVSKESYSEEDILGLSAFPALEKVWIEHATCSKPIFAGLSKVASLSEIQCYCTDRNVKDDAFKALKDSKSLKTFNVDNGPGITAECLNHLAEIPTLKRIRLSRCPDLKPADIEAFKKKRPDVEFVK